MNISLPFNTVLLLIGPTNSGKSHLTERLKKEWSEGLVTISSDDCRREILGNQNLHKYSPLMLQASQEAFFLLKNKLKSAMRFPMSLRNKVIIIDSTALNEDFRDEIAKICKDFSWNLACLVFDYEGGVEEYERFCTDSDKALIGKHLTRLRQKVRPTLRKSDYNAGVFTLKNKDEIGEVYLSVELSKAKELSLHHSEESYKYLIIGDIHGCYEEFIELLQKANFVIKQGKVWRTEYSPDMVVLLGDLVDKGPKSKEVIELIYNSMTGDGDEIFIPITGNHDLFFHQWFAKEREGYSSEKRTNYYGSTVELEHDDKAKMMMKFIYEASAPYLFTESFIATHAPCSIKYLGKDDPKSTAYMINLKFGRYQGEGSFTEFCDQLSTRDFLFMKNQSVSNWPFMFSGHVQVDNVTKVGSQIMLDTGAVYGNKLSGCIIDGSKYKIISVPSKAKYAEGELLTLFRKNPLEGVELTPNEKRRLRVMTNKGCPTNFVSGTMAPAPANTSNNSLEDVEDALAYYKSMGEEEVVLQTKWMGSRSQLYLIKGEAPDERPGIYQLDGAYAYWISRSGYLINHKGVDLTAVSNYWYQFMGVGEDFLILDGELCPWSILGQGLISDLYWPTYHETDQLIGVLETLNAPSVIAQYREKAVESNLSRLTTEDRQKAFRPHELSALEASLSLSKSLPPLEVLKDNLEVFKRQVELYGGISEPSFHPFSILKIMDQSGERPLPNNNLDDSHFFMDDEHFTLCSVDDVDKAREFFYSRQEANHEGIVVKPVSYRSEAAPALKVRNPDYLTLVYGPNYRFAKNYEKLVRGKHIKSKLASAIKQWNLGRELLGIPYYSISEMDRAKEIIFSFIQEERNVEKLDPRL